MASSRTFTSQLRIARLALVLSSATVFLCMAALMAAGLWIFAAPLLVVEVPYVWTVFFLWRLMSRQQPIASLADKLRAAGQEIPDGYTRVYADHDSGFAVHCTGRWRGADHFTRVELEDVEDVQRAEAGQPVGLPAVTFRVMHRPALVWRDTWVDEAVKGADDGEFHSTGANQLRTTAWNRWKIALLNHRTGVLVPDAEELSKVVQIVQNADRTWDIPSTRK